MVVYILTAVLTLARILVKGSYILREVRSQYISLHKSYIIGDSITLRELSVKVLYVVNTTNNIVSFYSTIAFLLGAIIDL